MWLLFFVPLLLIIVLICADARGGSMAAAINGDSEHYLRYVVLLAFVVAFLV